MHLTSHETFSLKILIGSYPNPCQTCMELRPPKEEPQLDSFFLPKTKIKLSLERIPFYLPPRRCLFLVFVGDVALHY